MASIFSVQNLHTFLRRKNFRPPGPPSRPPGPERGGLRSVLRSLLLRSVLLRSVLLPCPSVGVGLVSSAIMLLKSVVGYWLLVVRGAWCRTPCSSCQQPMTSNQQPYLRRRCRRFRAFCRRRGRCGCFLARVAQGLDLVEALLFLVHADAQEFDHRLADAQATLEFVHQPTAALKGQQDIKPVVELADDIGQT